MLKVFNAVLLTIVLFFSSCVSSGKNMIIEKVSAREIKVIHGLCEGSTFFIDEVEGMVIGDIYCHAYNMTDGKLLGEAFDFELMELEEGHVMVVITLEEFESIMEHYEVKPQSDNRFYIDFSKGADYASKKIWKENFFL